MEGIQKYIPLIAIGAIVLYAFSRMRSPATQVINRAVGFTGNQSVQPNRDAAQVAGFQQLASAAVGLGAQETNRFTSSLQAQVALAGQQQQTEQARILANSRAFDVLQQIAAQDRANQRISDELARQRRNDLLGWLFGTLGNILNRPATPQRSSGSSSGSSSSPTVPRRTTPVRRVPAPNVNPIITNPSYQPNWPEPQFDPFGFDYNPPYNDLPFFDFPDFDWLGDAPYIPQGQGDLYIPGIDDPPSGGNWWDWTSDGWYWGEPFYPESGGGDIYNWDDDFAWWN